MSISRFFIFTSPIGIDTNCDMHCVSIQIRYDTYDPKSIQSYLWYSWCSKTVQNYIPEVPGWVTAISHHVTSLPLVTSHMHSVTIRGEQLPGHHFIIKTIFPGMGFSIINIRWSWDRLIFIKWIPTHEPGKMVLILRWAPDSIHDYTKY